MIFVYKKKTLASLIILVCIDQMGELVLSFACGDLMEMVELMTPQILFFALCECECQMSLF